MKHLAKTKLIWLAVALVPLLVAIGCGAETQNPPTTNEPPAVENPSMPVIMPPAVTLTPTPSRTRTYDTHCITSICLEHGQTLDCDLDNVAIRGAVYCEVVTETVAEVESAPMSEPAKAETIVIGPAIIMELEQMDGAIRTFDEGTCEQVDFKFPGNRPPTGIYVEIQCVNLADSGFQLISTVVELIHGEGGKFQSPDIFEFMDFPGDYCYEMYTPVDCEGTQ